MRTTKIVDTTLFAAGQNLLNALDMPGMPVKVVLVMEWADGDMIHHLARAGTSTMNSWDVPGFASALVGEWEYEYEDPEA